MTQQIALFRRLIREAKQINDYNFRAYAVRRVRAGFDKNRNLEGWVPRDHDINDGVISIRS